MQEAVQAVAEFEAEILDADNDPEVLGSGQDVHRRRTSKLEAGVDLSDPAEVERFVQRYNDGLAA